MVLLLNVANQLFSVYILLNELAVCLHSLQSSCTRDNFNELSSDDSLPSPVELEGELLNHLSGVLAGVVHGSHPGRLFGAGSLLN